MAQTRRIALLLDLGWPFEWHYGTFVGVQRYAVEQGWETIIDEHIERPKQYQGIIARATPQLVRRLYIMKCRASMRIESPTDDYAQSTFWNEGSLTLQRSQV